MKSKRLPIILFFLFLASATSASWGALVEASDDTVLTNRSGGPFTIGFDFSVDVDVKINALGVEDSNSDGLAVDSSVGIWRVDPDGGESELIVSAAVPAGIEAVLQKGFRYVILEEVLTLVAGEIYRLGAVVGGDDPFTDTVDVGGGGSGFSGDAVEVLANRFAVGGELTEPVNDGTAELGRWVGGNASFITDGGEPTPAPGNALVNASTDTVLTNRGGGPFTIGFDFSVDVDVRINALGVEDSNKDGLTIDSSAGLWLVDPEGGDSSLLASVMVPAGEEPTLENGFRYVALDEVVTLTPGNVYRLGAVVGGDDLFTDTADAGGGGPGFSGESVEILANRFAVGAELLEPTNDGSAALGRWVGANAILLSFPPKDSGSGTTLVKASDDTALTNRRGGPFVIGFDFIPQADIRINALGVEDSDSDGLTIDSAAGLWLVGEEGAESELIASVDVPAGDEPILIEGFRYVKLDEVVTLMAGTSYRLGGIVGVDDPFTDTVDVGGGGAGFSGETIEITFNRFAVSAELVEPTNDGTAALGRWVGANAAFIGSPGDADNDGISDVWEDAFGLDKANAADANEDPDADGLSSLDEFRAQTDPKNADSDGDSLNDGVEIGAGTNPLRKDTDGDGLIDAVETKTGTFVDASNTGTNPLVSDSDSDRFSDGFEVARNTNPNDSNSNPLPEGGLLAYFDFEDDGDNQQALSVVGGFAGMIEGAEYESVEGRDGKVMTFGVGRIVVEDAADLNIASSVDQMSVSYWLTSELLAGGSFSMNAPSAAFGLSVQAVYAENAELDGFGGLNWDTSRPSSLNDGNGFFHRTTVFPEDVAEGFVPEAWHHWVFVKNGQEKSVWLDGAIIAEGVEAAPLNSDFSRFTIGSEALVGSMDDFAIFAKPLSGEEIGQLSQGVSPQDLGSPRLTFQITAITRAANLITIKWPSRQGQIFVVEYTENLGLDPIWLEIDDGVEAEGDETSFTDDTANRPTGWYRVRKG